MLLEKKQIKLSDFYKIRLHERLNVKIKNLQHFRTIVHKFYSDSKSIKNVIYKKNVKETYIVDIDKFVEIFNNILTYKSNLKQSKKEWDNICIDCWENKMNCENCYYMSLETLKNCPIKNITSLLLATHGEPLINVENV